MARPIRKLVQLVLDRRAAKRMERDAERSLGVVGRGLNKLKSAATAVGAALAAAFAVQAVIRFGREAVKVASEAEAIWNRLAGAVENTGVAFKDVEQDVRGFARAMQDATTVGDEDFAEILTELVTTSGDYEASIRNVGVVADLAAAKQIDLRSAAQLVGRAMVGQTATLTRYGIVVREGEDAVEAIRQKFAGMAANEAQTFQGRMKQLNNEWGDFKEAVGAALIAAGEGESAMERLTLAVRSMTEWVERNSGMFKALAEVLVGIGQAFAFVFRTAQRFADLLVGTVTVVVGGFVKVTNLGTRSLLGLGEAAAWLTGVLGMDGLSGSISDFTDRTREAVNENLRLADAILQAGKAAIQGRDAVAPPERPSRATMPSFAPAAPAAPGPTGAGEEEAADVDAVTKALRAKEQALRTIRTMSRLLGEDYDALSAEASVLTSTIKALADEGIGAADPRMRAMRDRLREIEDAATSAGDEIDKLADIVQGVDSALAANQTIAAALGEEYNGLAQEERILEEAIRSLAENGVGVLDPRMQKLIGRLEDVRAELKLSAAIAETAGALIGAAFGSGIGELAAAKAKQNAILAAEQLAQGFAATIGIISSGLAPAHYAAAAKFSAISAAWGSLAGATGGFSGGGGASAGGAASRGTGQGLSERAQPAGDEIHIYLDPLNANDPRVQMLVNGALENARERVGPNAKVRVHRRSRGGQE